MGFQTLATVVDDDILHLAGVADLEIIEADGRRFLIIAAAADSALSSFEIMGDGSMVFQSEVLWDANSGTSAVADIEVMALASGPFIVSAGRWDDDIGVYGFDAASGLTLAHSESDEAGNFANMLVSAYVQTASATVIYAAQQGAPGLKAFAVDVSDGSLSYLHDIADSSALKIGDVVDIATAGFHGKDFLFAASAFDAGLQVFEIGALGGLTAAGQSGAGDGLGYQYPSVLVTADVDGSALVLMGASGSGTITVFRVGTDGSLTPTDQVFDTLTTRFGGITTLEITIVNGVTYVLAAGADDGLTLFYLSKTGSLQVIEVLADDFSTTLDNVSDVEVFVDGTELHVLAGSASEHGVTHLSIDLPYATATIPARERPEPPPDTDANAAPPVADFTGLEGDEFLF